jgi:hypothetical protein
MAERDEDSKTVSVATNARRWSRDEIEATLKRLQMTGEIDATGVGIHKPLFDRILAAAPKDEDGRPCFKSVNFSGTIFGDDVNFERVTFGNSALFDGATFGDWAEFQGARFG